METSASGDQRGKALGNQREMTLSRLCGEAGLECPAEAGGIMIRGVTAHSRRVRPGWLFVAVPGMHTDGRAYIGEAFAAGAVAAVYQPDTDGQGTAQGVGHTAPPEASGQGLLLPADNVRVTMARLFDAWYGHPGRRLRLVGVTGTNGKTTVSFMLYHMLKAAGCPVGIIGTLGAVSPAGPVEIRPADERAAMTTPDPEELYAILAHMADATPPRETGTVVMEVSSHALALGKVEPLSFDLSIFTNLSPEHLDFHGTAEAYFEAKQRLFARSRLGVINGDDRWARSLPSLGLSVERWMICRSAPATCPAAVACPDGNCDRCLAEQIRSLGLFGMEYRLTTPDARLRLVCPVPGQFSVMNSMEAAVAALSLGVSPGVVKDSLASFPGVPGRLERILPGAGYETDFSVFIDFAHTPMALENLLLTFQRLRQGAGAAGDGAGRQGNGQPVRRIVVLFGCGGDRDRSKRRAMARIASRMADVVVVTSDNSRSEDPQAIIRDILAGIDRESEYAVIPDRAEAIRHTIRYARPGDIILLCGKGHETYEIDRTGRHPFSERDIALAAWRERSGG